MLMSPCVGTGTYTDPISFATATDNNYFPQCGIVYVPSLHKYFRNEDDCAECSTSHLLPIFALFSSLSILATRRENKRFPHS